jgi:hypothetical protein
MHVRRGYVFSYRFSGARRKAAHVFGHEFRASFVLDATRIVLLENCPAYIRKWIMGERR